jgi:hypothetical protein
MELEKFRIENMDKFQIEHEIASWERFITRQQDAKDRMVSQNSGVRSSSISADLAAFDISIHKANERIAALDAKLREKLEALGDE